MPNIESNWIWQLNERSGSSIREYSASHNTRIGRYQHTRCQYRTPHSRRVGWYNYMLYQYRTPHSSSVGWYRGRRETYRSVAPYTPPVPAYARSVPDIA
eukprot:3538857-Rhodomonas_salina.2